MNKDLRPLSEIAIEVSRLWQDEFGPKYRQRFYAAMAYLGPMTTLSTIKDNYDADTGRSVVAYFLSNITTWKGEDARRIKKELNDHLKQR